MEENKVINNKHARFQDADWYGEPKEIIIGGAGGIGSWVSLFLGRIGHTLYLFDMDTIDETNMAGQFYQVNQIGKNKAEATAFNVLHFCDNKNVHTMGQYTKDSETSPIVISCFDNMAARKLMFEKWKAQEDRDIFIDGRMLAEVGMIYCIRKGEEAAYEGELFDDSEVQEAPCSFKATSHCGALIASLMVGGLNNHLTNQKLKDDIRIIPFKYEFELPMFNFNEVMISKVEVKAEAVIAEPVKEEV